jgi:hypothetical protein
LQEDKFKENGETPHEEQLRLKNEFKRAAQQLFTGDAPEEEDDDGNNLLKVVNKNDREKADEKREFQRILASKPEQERALLDKFWGEEKNLDDTDKFLRKYILNHG